VKRFISLLALAGLTVGLALPIVAEDKLGKGEKRDKDGKVCKTECGCECVSIDKPFAEVAGKIPEAIRGAGLILAGEIDWAKLGTGKTTPHGSGTMPGEMTPRLEGATANVKTFLIADDNLVNEVKIEPAHALWIGKMVVFEKAGKTQILYMKPSLMVEHLKKSGMIPAEKIDDHAKKTADYERKLEQAVSSLKGDAKGGFKGDFKGTEKKVPEKR
jgi:hypothetical protein